MQLSQTIVGTIIGATGRITRSEHDKREYFRDNDRYFLVIEHDVGKKRTLVAPVVRSKTGKFSLRKTTSLEWAEKYDDSRPRGAWAWNPLELHSITTVATAKAVITPMVRVLLLNGYKPYREYGVRLMALIAGRTDEAVALEVRAIEWAAIAAYATGSAEYMERDAEAHEEWAASAGSEQERQSELRMAVWCRKEAREYRDKASAHTIAR